jgi:MFS superfamily sulfate permease-like transporter
MAFGFLAGLNPIVGLYMAVIPTITFCLFSTSRQISMGTFIVITLVTGNIADSYRKEIHQGNIQVESGYTQYSAQEISTAIAMIVSIEYRQWGYLCTVFNYSISIPS